MLINLRNALMAGKRLPYDAELEYLESTGTQYINTGVKADRSTVIKCALSVVSRSTNGYVVWGAAKGDGASGLYDAVALAEKYNNPSTLHLLDTYNNNNAQSISYGQDLLVDCVLSDGSITINGTTTSHNYYTLNRTADYPIWVFGENLAGNLFRPSKIKLKFLQIWQNGALVRDFIPVRKGTTGELYDRVSGRFADRNGDFVLGPDVVPVEYIESHGTEYIDTGVKKTSGTTIDCTFSLSATSTKAIFGARTSASALDRFMLMAIGSYFRFDARYQRSFGTPDTTSMFRFQYDGANATITNLTTGTTSTSDTPTGDAGVLDISLFGVNTNGVVGSLMQGRMYAFNARDNSNPVRSFRPVRVGTDATSWEGAMMDVLTRRIYRNAGTGNFGYGNDLKYPIPAE